MWKKRFVDALIASCVAMDPTVYMYWSCMKKDEKLTWTDVGSRVGWIEPGDERRDPERRRKEATA